MTSVSRIPVPGTPVPGTADTIVHPIKAAIGPARDDGGDHPAPAVDWLVSPGLTPYDSALAAMEQRIGEIRRGEAAERIWLLEHPALLTAGTSARDADLLGAGGLPIHRVGRGGQWTYHGPGQRIGYVMLDLGRPHGTVPARDVRGFVHGIERALIAALGDFGVAAETREGRVGLWVIDPKTGGERKIAAIGLRVTRGVTWHGFALNIAPDLSAFERIVPCGVREHGVTSLASLGVAAPVDAADGALRRSFARVFGVGA